jgi:D-alanyl-D-alanine carboxypeptidase
MKNKSYKLIALMLACLCVSALLLSSCELFSNGDTTTAPDGDSTTTAVADSTTTEENTTSPEPDNTTDTSDETTTPEDETTAAVTDETSAPEDETTDAVTDETTAPEDIEIPWNLVLVNPWHSLPDNYTPPALESVYYGQVDARCAKALRKMLDDCTSAGFTPIVCSSFRTHEFQTQLFNNRIQSYINMGYGEEEARTLAATITAVPGTSEHQLGLAVDIVDVNYQILDDNQANQPAQKWLMENCWKYGFILRYEKTTQDITGIVYEPWHYRYVGVEAAAYITTNSITFEEYYEMTFGLSAH